MMTIIRESVFQDLVHIRPVMSCDVMLVNLIISNRTRSWRITIEKLKFLINAQSATPLSHRPKTHTLHVNTMMDYST